MLELLQTPLTVLHIVVCLFLVLIVLLQPGKSGGLGAALGGAGAQQVFGGRGAGNFLSKLTWASASLFFVTSMVLAYLSSSVDDSLQERAAAIQVPLDQPSPQPGGAGQAPGAAADTPSPDDDATRATEEAGDDEAPAAPEGDATQAAEAPGDDEAPNDEERAAPPRPASAPNANPAPAKPAANPQPAPEPQAPRTAPAQPAQPTVPPQQPAPQTAPQPKPVQPAPQPKPATPAPAAPAPQPKPATPAPEAPQP